MTKQLKRFLPYVVQVSLVFMAASYFFIVSPFTSSGSLQTTNILLAAVLILTTLFLITRMVMLILFKFRAVTLAAAVLSFSLTEILLLSSLRLTSVATLVGAGVFNVLCAWYIDKRLNKR